MTNDEINIVANVAGITETEADDILESAGGILRLATMTAAELEGLGLRPSSARRLYAANEYRRAVHMASLPVRPYLTDGYAVSEYVDDIRHYEVEHMMVIACGSRLQAIARKTISIGTLDKTLCHPRDVMRFAVTRNAANVILVHNHPSGDCTPSAGDIAMTRALVEAGKICGITVCDHVIVGAGKKWLSMRKEALM